MFSRTSYSPCCFLTLLLMFLFFWLKTKTPLVISNNIGNLNPLMFLQASWWEFYRSCVHQMYKVSCSAKHSSNNFPYNSQVCCMSVFTVKNGIFSNYFLERQNQEQRIFVSKTCLYLLCTLPSRSQPDWAGCIVFLDYLMIGTYRIRKKESNFKGNYRLLQFTQVEMVLYILNILGPEAIFKSHLNVTHVTTG